MTDYILVSAAWAVCGFLAYGRTFAHFQRKFPDLAMECRGSDRCLALFFAALGPFGLFCSLILGQHGFMWRAKS